MPQRRTPYVRAWRPGARLRGLKTSMLVLLLASPAPVIHGQSSIQPMLTLSEFDQSSEPPAGGHTTCINVWGDGRFHLEKWSQQLPDPNNHSLVYDSTLQGEQLRALVQIIDSPALRDLPRPIPADPSAAKTSVRGTQSWIRRTKGIQEVGYFAWKTRDQGIASDSPGYVTHNPQSNIEVILQPLEHWLHHVTALNIPARHSDAVFCQTREDDSAPDADSAAQVSRIVDRVLKRCYTYADSSAHSENPRIAGITWRPPTTEDYLSILRLGDAAVPALAAYLSSDGQHNDFEQLIAVRFLGFIGTPETIAPLSTALNQDHWQVVRLEALQFLGEKNELEVLSFVEAMKDDKDPLLANRALTILKSLNSEE